MIGEEFGFFAGVQNNRQFINGNLLGYIFSGKFQVMGEYFMQHSYTPEAGTEGFMNYGFRYSINGHFTLMGSFGTEIVTPPGEDRQLFISFLGLQSDF